MKTTLAVVATAVISALLFSAAGTSGTAAPTTVTKTLRLGQNLYVPGLDLFCISTARSSRSGMYCGRYSAGSNPSRRILITKWEYEVWNKTGSHSVYTANRSP